jgi:hypothetical protein
MQYSKVSAIITSLVFISIIIREVVPGTKKPA